MKLTKIKKVNSVNYFTCLGGVFFLLYSNISASNGIYLQKQNLRGNGKKESAISETKKKDNDKLDFSFIQGGAGANQLGWDELNSKYIPGEYFIDLIFNDKKPIKKSLQIAKGDENTLCFTTTWLSRSGILIDKEYFKDNYIAGRDCYVLEKSQSVTIDMDIASQTLRINIPQIALLQGVDNSDWDYGNTALRVNYHANTTKNDLETSSFGSIDLKGNAKSWVVTSTSTITDNEADISMFTATRAFRSFHADLSVGKIFTGDEQLGSLSTYGATLRSNSSMKMNDIGYMPVFSGVAKSHARVTLSQSGNILYSEPVPPGPFAIKNVTLLNSGDVQMIITEQDGGKTIQTFPLTVMTGMITPSENEFSVSVGEIDKDSSESQPDGSIASLSYGYGLNNLSLRAGTVLHDQYYGLSSSATTSLGAIGGLSLKWAWSQAEYENSNTESGANAQILWNKYLSETGTSVYVSLARRLSDQYIDLSSFNPKSKDKCLYNDSYRYDNINISGPSDFLCFDNKRNVSRNDISVGLNQGVGVVNAGLTLWHRDYWNLDRKEDGLTGTLSTYFQNGTSINLGGSMSKNDDQDNWSASLSISIPFTAYDRRYSSFTTVTTGKDGGEGITTGITGSVNDRINYSVSGGQSSDGSAQGNMSADYNSDKAGFGFGLSQSSNSTTGSASVTGSILALPAAKSIMFSRTVSDTVAIANIKDVSGVKFYSGIDKTDSNGNVVIPLNSYRYNTVTVDSATLPQDVELSTTSQGVVPVDQAVVWMPFETWNIRRYILQVRNTNKTFVPSGSWAKDKKGTPLGFVAQDGVLLINAIDNLGDVQIGRCTIPASKIQESNKIQEVYCE